jgi:phenylalanyl-tRNA synthetase alpha chain
VETFLNRVSEFHKKAEKAFVFVKDLEELMIFQHDFLGKKSELNLILKSLKDLSNDEKKIAGPEIQKVKIKLFNLFESKKNELELQALNEKLEKDRIDVTKNLSRRSGNLHPISIVQKKVEQIFCSMGFEIADGPEVETEWHNFDALNLPNSHPARDMQDTFWISKESKDPLKNSVLRTQTSNVQIRTMKKYGAPVRLIAPGRVFRNEDVDASHDAVFYQVEGLVVDEGISLAHLKGTIETMLSALFEIETTVRFRPGYFPFVEPGLEVDFSCAICGGKGCKTCKNSGWIEFMGAGMVHPNVLRNCGVDPERFSGFAFGFGLTRLVMMKYEIDDIRLLFSNKNNFLSQF